MRDGALLIADRSSERGSYLYYSYPWNVDPAIKATVEVRAKALSGHSGIIIANGVAEDELHIYPDRIGLLRAGLSHAMDAASDLHDYRVEIEGSDIRVFVDGELVIDGPGKLTATAANGRNSISFGERHHGRGALGAHPLPHRHHVCARCGAGGGLPVSAPILFAGWRHTPRYSMAAWWSRNAGSGPGG